MPWASVSSPGQGDTRTRQLSWEREEGPKPLTCSQGQTNKSDPKQGELAGRQGRNRIVMSAAGGRNSDQGKERWPGKHAGSSKQGMGRMNYDAAKKKSLYVLTWKELPERTMKNQGV